MFLHSFFFVILNLLTVKERVSSLLFYYLSLHLVQLFLRIVLKFPSKLKTDHMIQQCLL
jgi:hypothetical protein